MGGAKPEIMKALGKFKDGARKYGVEKIALFGSQASGKAGVYSDIDFIVASTEAVRTGISVEV